MKNNPALFRSINLKKISYTAILTGLMAGSYSFSDSSASVATTDTTTAGEAVSVELVLAVDVSTSIDATEFNLQHQGYIDAFNSDEVKDAIKALPNGLAVNMMFWSSNRNDNESNYDIGWYKLVRNNADGIDGLDNFITKLENIKREVVDGQNKITIDKDMTSEQTIVMENGTDLAHAITASQNLIQSNNYTGDSLVIDMSGDGLADDTPIDADDVAYIDQYISDNNLDIGNYLKKTDGTNRSKCDRGHIGAKAEENEVAIEHVFCPPVLEARDAAVNAGIKINGLPIVADSPTSDSERENREDEVDMFYKNNVVGGENSFYITATFDTFSQAVTQKISCEINGLTCFFAD